MGSDRNFLKVCPGTDELKRDGTTQWLKRCECTCDWFAMVYICAPLQCPSGAPGQYYAPIQGHVTIRSQQPMGTVLTINIDQSATSGCRWSYLQNCSSSFGQLTGTFTIKVGLDTGGQWEPFGTIVVGGQPTLYVFINAFTASGDPSDPRYCDIPEYGLPVVSEIVRPFVPIGGGLLATTNPGPIKWQDVVAMANSVAGTSYITDDECLHQCFGTLVPPGYYDGAFTLAIFDGNVNQFGTPYPIDTIDYFAAHVFAGKACFTSIALGSIDGTVSGGYTRRVYQKQIFTCPGTVATDTTGFDLTVTQEQFYTPGVTVDGTHVWDNTQETDQDIVPTAELDGAAVDEFILWNSISRTSFGHYKFNKLQFVCRAPSTRRINLWADHQHSGGAQAFRNSPWKQQSADIAVTIGPADCVDVIATGASPPHYGLSPVRAGDAILGPATAALRARILDICGESANFNVVPTATNTVVAALGSSGTNFYTSPTLHGTTSRAAVSGLADFNDLYVLGIGRHYKLTFTSTGLFVGLNGNKFDEISIYPDLVFETLPTINAGVACSIKVDMVDAFGAALVPSTADVLTLSGAGSFSGFGSVTPSGGVATFTGSFPAAGTYVIQVVTSGTNYDGPGVAGIPAVTISVTVLP